MMKRKTETVNDLSRCLDQLDMDATLIAVIEMSQSVGSSLALFRVLSASR